MPKRIFDRMDVKQKRKLKVNTDTIKTYHFQRILMRLKRLRCVCKVIIELKIKIACSKAQLNSKSTKLQIFTQKSLKSRRKTSDTLAYYSVLTFIC